MQKYIIFETVDCDDEFDYPVVSVFDEEIKELVLNKLEELGTLWFDEFYFGTNEFLTFEYDSLKEMIERAKPISDEDLFVLHKFLPTYTGLDIIESFIERILPQELM